MFLNRLEMQGFLAGELAIFEVSRNRCYPIDLKILASRSGNSFYVTSHNKSHKEHLILVDWDMYWETEPCKGDPAVILGKDFLKYEKEYNGLFAGQRVLKESKGVR